MAQSNFERDHMRTVYRIFQRYALDDQRRYWQRSSARYRKAASQVNVIMAIFGFLTGFSAALAGLLVSAYLVDGSFANQGACANLQSSRNLVTSLSALGAIEGETATGTLEIPEAFDARAVQDAVETLTSAQSANCDFVLSIVNVLMIMAVVTPAIGGAFTTLASLYQWDRTISLYDSALENLEVADSQSPIDEMDDLTYKAALRAYIDNTLRVMAEESAQWGQSVRTPPQLEAFIADEKMKAARAQRRAGASPLTAAPEESDSESSDKG